VSWLLACAGWAAAIVLVGVLLRRRGRLADAEHELRGAAAVIGLAADRAARTGLTSSLASLVRLQIDRMDAALADLPRSGRRRGSSGNPDVDVGRLAQVLANLIANAAEHGEGPIEVQASRATRAARLRIRNRNRPREPGGRVPRGGRGRGLAIAERAALELGGRVRLEAGPDETVATVELPADDLRRAA